VIPHYTLHKGVGETLREHLVPYASMYYITALEPPNEDYDAAVYEEAEELKRLMDEHSFRG